MTSDPFARASRHAKELTGVLGVPDVFVVCGSGAGGVVDQLGSLVNEVDMAELEGFPVPLAHGHHPTIAAFDLEGQRIWCARGRVHLYDGFDSHGVAHAVRCGVFAGAERVVLTNASGSLRRDWGPGQLVMLTDHINLTGTSPLVGPYTESYGARFMDCSAIYSAELRQAAHDIMPELGDGVYAVLGGPQYETPSEIRMLGVMGADMAGMSTILEAIAARHLGAEVTAVSLVTNLCTGISELPLSHDEVLAAGLEAGERLGKLVAHLASVKPKMRLLTNPS